ncbi:MAG: 50S ribosomal protein L20 [Anaerolineae bacterium]
MARVKGGPQTHRRHKKILKRAKGFQQGRRRLFRRANESVLKALANSYRDRRLRKRDFRRLWIQRINAAARQNGLTYGRFMHGLRTAEVELDRKVLADLAVRDAEAFRALVEVARQA